MEAGADFLMSQPIFDPEDAHRFLDSLRAAEWRVRFRPSRVLRPADILEPGGVLFSTVPEGVRAELEAGRSGVEIAIELYRRVPGMPGLRNVYLMPPIRRGGARDYGAAREFLGRVA